MRGFGCNNIYFSTLEILFKTASAFVCDTNFWTNGENCEEMTEKHATRCETVVGKIEPENLYFTLEMVHK